MRLFIFYLTIPQLAQSLLLGCGFRHLLYTSIPHPQSLGLRLPDMAYCVQRTVLLGHHARVWHTNMGMPSEQHEGPQVAARKCVPSDWAPLIVES